MSWLLTNFIGAILLPPLNLLLLAALGLWLWHKRPRIARALVSIAFALLWLLSTPIVADALLQALEGKPHALDTRQHAAEAIVVLGGGTYFHAAEYGGDTVGRETLQRLRYAATLQRQTGLPILVSGGNPERGDSTEAEQMQQTLERELGVPVRWREDESNNTWQNARMSFALLQAEGISRIYLVTHAWHMPRAVFAFRAAGFHVVPAPTAYTTRHHTDVLDFLPSSRALDRSRWFLHELIGLLWYRLQS
ncbi:MAG: YdcF family protein [Sideroxydans sp.]